MGGWGKDNRMVQLKAFIGKYDKVCTLIMGICTVLAFYIMWCFSTISYQGMLYEILHCVCTLVTIFFYGCCITIFRIYWGAEHLRRQLQILNVGIFAAFLLIFILDIGTGSLWLVTSDIIWLMTATYSFHVLKYRFIEIRVAGAWIKENYGLVLMLIVACILGVYPTMLQFRWDGALYEQACRVMDIHSMSSLGAYAHLAQGYGVLFCLVKVLVRDTDYAMAVTNIIMYLTSILAFWGIMRQLIPGKKKWSYLLVTAVYACSPYTLGMVNYYSLDFATLCLFVCMLYFWLRREWVLQFVAALFACFTKEPAIISYGTLCVGMIFVDIMQQNNSKYTERISNLLKKLYYYPMLVTGVLWVITYLLLGGWSSGNGETAIDTVYTVDKLKVLYILNFSWIFVGIFIWGSICLAKGRLHGSDINWWSVPLVVSIVGFTLFGMIFKTANHARYVAQMPAVLYLIGGYVLLSGIGEKTLGITAGIIASLMLISSYSTIDPISRLCFTVLDTGDGQMLTTGIAVPGDSMIYNKQMLGMEYALNEAVEYAVHKDCMVIMPMYGESPNIFDGLMQGMEEQEYGWSALTYWSEKDGKRTIYEGEDTSPFIIYEWSDMADIAQLPLHEKGRHCFIYSSMLGEDQAQQIRERYGDAEYKEYQHGGWTISLLVF